MKSEISWLVYAVPLAGASISVLGAAYVGWRQRRLTRALADFQVDVADGVFRRQLCLSFASRAHLVANRAAEVDRGIAALGQLEPEVRERELEKRTERLDRACDAFFEAWSELFSSELAPSALLRSVGELTDELEASRLRMLRKLRNNPWAGSDQVLVRVVDVAHRCHRESSALATDLSKP
ncbi:MAG: hypothetical protein ACJ75T_02465 [Solirubrobacterales bacterium]